MLVTTKDQPREQLEEEAREVASGLNAVYTARNRQTIAQLFRNYDQALKGVLVADDQKWRFYSGADEPPLFFHPSMAAVRIKRLQKGETDRMLQAAGVESGDRILDCTAGLCSDAIVFAYGVGETGAVDAVEESAIVYTTIKKGMDSFVSNHLVLDAAIDRVRLMHTNAGSYLHKQGENAYDIVYMDPMFERTKTTSDHLLPLRAVASHELVTTEIINQAKRVARKRVVCKAIKTETWWREYGFEVDRVDHRKIIYGVIEC